MNRRITWILVMGLVLASLIATTGCTFELFCLQRDVVPKPIAVAAAPVSTAPQTAQPRSAWEAFKSFITIYPFMKDVLAAIEANKVVGAPVEYHTRFILLRVGK
jgi:hypothetical protein